MLRYIENGSLFDSDADALVNTVNCVGTMGKGLAKEFAKQFPECVGPYKSACKSKKLRPGSLMFVKLEVKAEFEISSRPAVILFPTKDHWRGKSKLEWIDEGLTNLKLSYKDWGLTSVALPKIGCGLGGLDWKQVKSLLEARFSEDPLDVQVYLART